MKTPIHIPKSISTILAVWLVAYVSVAISLGGSYPVWYSFAIFIGVSAGAATDPFISVLAILAGITATSPKRALSFALIIAIAVSVYVDFYGLIPEKGITLKAFSGRAVAASTIAIAVSWFAMKVRLSAQKN